MYCPIMQAECREDCAWFEQSRRKYQDHIEGTCAVKNLNSEMERVKDSICKLESTLYNKEF